MLKNVLSKTNVFVLMSLKNLRRQDLNLNFWVGSLEPYPLYYIRNKLPWEKVGYMCLALTALCIGLKTQKSSLQTEQSPAKTMSYFVKLRWFWAPQSCTEEMHMRFVCANLKIKKIQQGKNSTPLSPGQQSQTENNMGVNEDFGGACLELRLTDHKV